MAQLFSNNAASTLAVGIGTSDTSLTIQSGDGANFESPTGGDYELITLLKFDSSGNVTQKEIVKCTARSTDTFTITRAQEGTTAGTWAADTTYVRACVTAGTLDTFPQGFDNGGNAKGADSVNLQPSRASATQVASGANTVNVGVDSTASADSAISIGNAPNSSAANTISIGKSVTVSAANGIGVGLSATNRIADTIVMSGTQMIRKSEDLGSSHLYGAGARVTIMTDEFSLLTLADSVASVTIPTGASFYVDSMSIIITQLTGTVTVHPQVASGNGSSTTALLAATALANEAVKMRQLFATPVTYAGQTALNASVKTAGTGFTLLKGRFAWHGLLVEDQ